MLDQFQRLVGVLEKNVYKNDYLRKKTNEIIKNLKRLGFIEVGNLNKYKYVYLRQPTFALISGDYNNSRRTNKKKDFKTQRFYETVTKIEYFLEYNEIFPFYNIDTQLVHITRRILELIIDDKNRYGYDIDTINDIIKIGDYQGVRNVLNENGEHTNKLGLVRFVWEEIGKEFWKLKLQGQSISRVPHYFKLNILPDGRITLHYVPIIILFDSLYDLNYYKGQSNKFFHSFFNMAGNVTQGIKDDFMKSNKFQHPHFNKVGYTFKLIGFDEINIVSKAEVLNAPYFKNNQYSPLVELGRYEVVNIGHYFQYSSGVNNKSRIFNKVNNKLNNIIGGI